MKPSTILVVSLAAVVGIGVVVGCKDSESGSKTVANRSAELLDELPKGMTFVGGFSMERLRGGSLMAQLRKQDPDDWKKANKKCGFPVERGLDNAVFASDSMDDDSPVFGVATTSMSRTKIIKCLRAFGTVRQQKGVVKFVADDEDDDGPLYLKWVDKRTIRISDDRDRIDWKKRGVTSSRLRKTVADVDRGTLVWMAGIEVSDDVGAVTAMGGVDGDDIQAWSFSVDYPGKLVAKLRITFDTSKQAKRAVREVNSSLDDFTDSGMPKKYRRAVSLKADGRDLVGRLKLTRGQIDTLSTTLKAFFDN